MRRQNWRVQYVAGPQNLEQLLNDTSARESPWSVETIVAHSGPDPRYTVILWEYAEEGGEPEKIA